MDKEDIAIWVTITAGILSIIADAASIERKAIRWLRRRR